MKKILGILFITLCTIFLARYIIVGQAVYGDAIYYWAYTRSIYFDHDIELSNELYHHYSPIGNNIPEVKKDLQPINNVLQHHLPVGPSLAWLPFFLLADLFTIIIQSLGFSLLRFGYSDIYQITVGIGNVTFITFGIFYAIKFVNKYFSQKSAVIATITVLLSTNLIYYSSLDVINSHPPSFILSCIFLYLWINTSKKRKLYEWAILGIIIGALTTIRTQEVLFSILILYDLLQEMANFVRTRKLHDIRNLAIHAFIVTCGFIIGFLPQILVWHVAFDNAWQSPYLYGDSPFSLINPNILGVLFDHKVGLLFYTPLIAVSLVGLYFMREKNQKLSFILILFFLLQFYMISAWRGWHQGASYSIRMLISCMPIFILGTAAIIEKLQKIVNNKTIIVLIILFAVHNFMMILIFQLLIQDPTFDGNNITQLESIKRVKDVIKNVSTF